MAIPQIWGARTWACTLTPSISELASLIFKFSQHMPDVGGEIPSQTSSLKPAYDSSGFRHNEIIEMNIGARGVKGTGDQAHIAAAELGILDLIQLFTVDVQTQ